ncbi:hypothetical protein THAOC_36800, partial [Thalassiosira oceanica]
MNKWLNRALAGLALTGALGDNFSPVQSKIKSVGEQPDVSHLTHVVVESADRHPPYSSLVIFQGSFPVALNLNDGMKRMTLLRGSLLDEHKDMDPREVAAELKNILSSQVEHLKKARERLSASDDAEEVSSIINSLNEDSSLAISAPSRHSGVSENKDLAPIDLAPIDTLAASDVVGLDAKDRANIIDDGLIGLIEYTIESLDTVSSDADTTEDENLSNHRRRLLFRESHRSNDYADAYNYEHPHKLQDMSVHYSHGDLPPMKSVRDLRHRMGTAGRRRTQEERPQQCHVCSEDDIHKLQQCAKELTPYDLATRVLGGYVVNDPTSNDHGNLATENLANINDRNKFSLQLSVSEVCAAVNTRNKVKIRSIGKLFDFRNHAVQVKDPEQGSQGGANTPRSKKFSLSHRHAVRCCKDSSEKNSGDWLKSPVAQILSSCPATLEQRWTGDLPHSNSVLAPK